MIVKATAAQTIASIGRDGALSLGIVNIAINEEINPYQFAFHTRPEHLSFDECKKGFQIYD